MADTDGETKFEGGLDVRRTVKLLDGADIEVPGVPQINGFTARARLERDGSVVVSISAFATYADREVSYTEDIDLLDTTVDEALRDLIETHKARLSRKAFREAMRAWEVAIRNKEVEG